MNCEQYEAALGDYVDGTLQSSVRPADVAALAALEAHLAACGRCRATVEDLGAIRVAARGLDAHAPSPQLWRRIAADVERQRPHRWWVGIAPWSAGWRPLAAAAVMLVVLAGAAYLVWRPAAPAPQVAADTSPAPAVGQTETADDQFAASLSEDYYAQAIAGLQELADDADAELDPLTAEVLQANLTVIDDAIGESRAALDTEPGNAVAQESLFDALRGKVALLQDTIALLNEMRQGDQEATARIVTELNQ
jgi:hypothetical protein